VDVAFSTASDGDCQRDAPRAAFVKALTGRRTRIATPIQQHGSKVFRVDSSTPRREADGLISDDQHLALGVYGADCPGLVISAGPWLGVAHCGWRSTAAGIVARMAHLLAAAGAPPVEQWTALIGPGISAERYEVDAPVLDAYDWDPDGITPGRPGHAWLDIRRTVLRDCRRAGLKAVAVTGICTARDPRLHSFRHQGAGLSQLLLAWRNRPSKDSQRMAV
jgi:copper oxidase (laccase) domain-containing protein